MKQADAKRHLRWPADRFYWAVLDTSLLPAGPGRGRQLGFLFEASLPVGIDQVQAVYRRISGDRCLACGIDRAQLEQVDPAAVALSPDAIPSGFAADVDPEMLNLLTGAFTPPRVRRLRGRWRAGVAVLVVLCAAAFILGTQRRVEAARQQADTVRERTTALFARGLATDITEAAGLDPTRAQLNLRARLRDLRQTRPDDVSAHELGDVSETLAAVFAAWPRELEIRVDTCTVTSSVIVITGDVPDTDGAQRLADALEAVPGWQLQQPDVETKTTGVRVSLRLARQAEEGAP